MFADEEAVFGDGIVRGDGKRPARRGGGELLMGICFADTVAFRWRRSSTRGIAKAAVVTASCNSVSILAR